MVSLLPALWPAAPLEYPDKLYIGTFERTARFDANLEEAGISLSLYRTGEAPDRKTVHMHFHYALFAEILRVTRGKIRFLFQTAAVSQSASGPA